MRLKALLDKASTHLNENSRFSAIVSNPRKMLRTPPFHIGLFHSPIRISKVKRITVFVK